MAVLQKTLSLNLILFRAVWVRFNRLLAWALILTPLLEFVLHISLRNAMVLDFGLLLAHGVLSLILFGLPKVKRERFTFSMHVMGFRPRGMSARNNFLLTGYRLAMPFVTQIIAIASMGIPPLSAGIVIMTLYPTLRGPITWIQHIHGAIKYALMRWRLPPGLAMVATALSVCVRIVNFLTSP